MDGQQRIGEDESQPVPSSDTAILLDHDRQRRTATMRVGSGLFVVEMVPDPERPSQVRITHGDLHLTGEVRFAVVDSLRRFADLAARKVHQPPALVLRSLHAVRALVEQIQREAPAASTPRMPGVITEAERTEAETWLGSANLLERIAHDLTELGWVADASQQHLGFLAALSRRCDQPAWIALSATDLLPYGVHILAEITPLEDLVRATSLSDQALIHAETDALRHRLLVIDDLAVSAKVATALRVLHVNGCLSAQQPIRDPETGVSRLRLHRVDGPVAVLGALTAGALDHRLEPYVATVSLDGRAPTPSPIPKPNATRRALLIRRLHTVQRCIGSAEVAFGDPALTAAPVGSPTVQRDHRLTIALASASALLHRRQRPWVDDCVVATEADVLLARRLVGLVSAIGVRGISDVAQRLLAQWRASGGAPRTFRDWKASAASVVPGLTAYRLRVAVQSLVASGLIEASDPGQGKTVQYHLPSEDEDQLFEPFDTFRVDSKSLNPVRAIG